MAWKRIALRLVRVAAPVWCGLAMAAGVDFSGRLLINSGVLPTSCCVYFLFVAIAVVALSALWIPACWKSDLLCERIGTRYGCVVIPLGWGLVLYALMQIGWGFLKLGNWVSADHQWYLDLLSIGVLVLSVLWIVRCWRKATKAMQSDDGK
jgi:membrane protein DedA with SNARE-associated domain